MDGVEGTVGARGVGRVVGPAVPREYGPAETEFITSGGLHTTWVGVSGGFQRIRSRVRFGRIRVDCHASSPAGIFWKYFAVYMGILTLSKWIPDSDGFGRGSDSGGFGWIPGFQTWISQPVYNSIDEGYQRSWQMV